MKWTKYGRYLQFINIALYCFLIRILYLNMHQIRFNKISMKNYKKHEKNSNYIDTVLLEILIFYVDASKLVFKVSLPCFQ